MTKEKFLAYYANKEQFITLLCLLANRANIETHVAESDCDTQKSFGTRFKTLSVDVIAEDSEILIMLNADTPHHKFSKGNQDLYKSLVIHHKGNQMLFHTLLYWL